MRGLTRPGERKRLFLACFSCTTKRREQSTYCSSGNNICKVSKLSFKKGTDGEKIHRDLANTEIVGENFLRPQNFGVDIH